MKELLEKLAEKQQKIEAIENPIDYTNAYIKFLSDLHPSDAYGIIKENLVPAKNQKIMSCKKFNVKVYQELQDLMDKCRKSHVHDVSPATNLDVDKAISKSYGITTKMIRAVIDMENDRFDKITKAINKIEEHLGIDVTNFMEDNKDDSTNNENEQRVKETTNRTRKPRKTK